MPPLRVILIDDDHLVRAVLRLAHFPVVASAICMEPRRLLTEHQVVMLTVLKEDVPGFAAIRHLAIRFHSLSAAS